MDKRYRTFLLLVCCAFSGLAYAAPLTWDNGNWGDSFAPDTDTDGYEDVIDAFPLDITEWFDTDTDGIGNNADWDDDGDNVVDLVDSDPLDGGNVVELDLPLEGNGGYKGTLMRHQQSR